MSNGSNLWGLYVFNNYERSGGGKQSTTVFLGKVTAPNNTEVVLPFYYITATAKRHVKVRFYNFTQSRPEYVNAWKIVHADGSIENITFTSGSLDKELTTNSLIFPDLANSGATALNYVDFMKFNLGSSSSTGYKSEGYYAIGSPQSSLSFYQWSYSTLNNFRLAVEEVYPDIVGYNALHLEEFDDTYEGELYHYTIANTPLLTINTDNRMEYGFLNAGIKTGNLYSVGADNELFYIDPTYKYQHWAQGGSGSNVNADWSENDSSAGSYVQNRTHYVERDVPAVKNYPTILNIREYSREDEQEITHYYYSFELESEYKESLDKFNGATITINILGTDYTTTLHRTTDPLFEGESVLGGSIGNDMSFFLVLRGEEDLYGVVKSLTRLIEETEEDNGGESYQLS